MQVETDYDYKGEITKERLMNALDTLPEGYKVIFNLYVIEGLTHPEIADYLEISVNTSKSQLHKARKMLRDQLEEKKSSILNVS